MTQRIEPGPGQESVWDYPRPPKVEPTDQRVRIIFNGQVIAETTRAIRVLETSHPPSYYIPHEDLKMEFFTQTSRHTYCEFKGMATYWNVKVGDKLAENAAWSYENPKRGYESIQGYLSFYPSRMDACYVGEEKVTAQEGDFYGGWITSNIVGPFKGGPGTWGW
jgi:uncharacterized protein (DUF427 family)